MPQRIYSLITDDESVPQSKIPLGHTVRAGLRIPLRRVPVEIRFGAHGESGIYRNYIDLYTNHYRKVALGHTVRACLKGILWICVPTIPLTYPVIVKLRLNVIKKCQFSKFL